MYYRYVNRGLTFTKAGIYSILLVLAVGMLAILSGVNGLYIFLSAGLAILIVSGILSERAMKSLEIVQVEKATVEAGRPFSVGIKVLNRSRNFNIMTIDIVCLKQVPRWRLMRHSHQALFKATCDNLAPEALRTCTSEYGSRLPRGLLTEALLFCRTEYPLGLLEKFKMVRIPADLCVVPAVNSAQQQLFRNRIRTLLNLQNDQLEFYCHREFQSRDSRKHIDWRRSANKPVRNWVVKQYNSDANRAKFAIEIDPKKLHLDERSHEAYLSTAYTLYVTALEFDANVYLFAYGNILENKEIIERWFSGYPLWHQSPPTPGDAEVPNNMVLIPVVEPGLEESA
jgi:uncharacterized protein (DUF58 family)